MKLFTHKLAAAALAVLGTMAVTAGTAEAAAGYDRCSTNHMCAFAWPDGQGPFIEMINGVEDLAHWNGGILNDQITTGWNRSKYPFCFYVHSHYRGDSYQSNPGTSGFFPHNDAYSSIRRGTC
jgi:hypothetical protein